MISCLAGRRTKLRCERTVLREVPPQEIWIRPAAGDGVRGALSINRYLDQPRQVQSKPSLNPHAQKRKRVAPYADGMKGSFLGPATPTKRSKTS
jgi:hypothetical protein